jgi:hypothetical protein
MGQWVKKYLALGKSNTNLTDQFDGRSPTLALECCKYFTLVVHRSAEVDLTGVCGMGRRLSVESVDVSNGVKR